MIARGLIAIVLAGLLSGDVLAIGSGISVSAGGAEWRERPWPFLTDEWGVGRAFECAPPYCAAPISVLMRNKVGMCGCTVGIERDDHVDRVADVDLINGRSVALAQSEPVGIFGMKGLARRYRVENEGQPRRVALAVALARECDAVVATVLPRHELAAEQEQMAYALLHGDVFRRIAQVTPAK